MNFKDISIIASFALFSIFSVGFTTLVPQPNEPVLVIGNPLKEAISTFNIVARAEGAVVDGTAFPFAIIATSKNPQFVEQLYNRGAWFVVSSRILTGCFTLTARG
ncbi:MAG: hypothetical protein GY927_02025 [bacterium]|nr:hypothetical protein [bacterium]